MFATNTALVSGLVVSRNRRSLEVMNPRTTSGSYVCNSDRIHQTTIVAITQRFQIENTQVYKSCSGAAYIMHSSRNVIPSFSKAQLLVMVADE